MHDNQGVGKMIYFITTFPGGSMVKTLPASVRDVGSLGQEDPGSGRSPEEGNGNPLQYPCPGNPVDRGD